MSVLNLKQTADKCDVIERSHATAVTVGTPIYLPGLGAAVPHITAGASPTAKTSFYISGRFRATISTSISVSQGDALYYDSAAGTVQKTVPAAGFYLGVAAEDGTATAGYVDILLNKVPESVTQDAFERLSPATISTAGAGTITAAHVVGGLILRDPNGADRSDTLPTAALLVAAITGVVADGAVKCLYRNTSDAAEILTLVAGAGDTLSPTVIQIMPSETKELVFRVTNATVGAEAVTVYDTTSTRVSVPVDVTTAGAGTITAAQVLSGVIVRDPTGANRTDTLPTAALLVAAVPGCRVGTVLPLLYINSADADETITLAVGSGGTMVPAAMTIKQNSAKVLSIRVTNITGSAEAYSLYDLSNDGLKQQANVKVTVTALSDADATPTAAQLLGGVLTMTPGAARNCTMPTAADLYALMPNAVAGTSVEFTIKNLAATTHAITVVNSASITNGGSTADLTIAASTNATYKLVFTSGTVAVYYRK